MKCLLKILYSTILHIPQVYWPSCKRKSIKTNALKLVKSRQWPCCSLLCGPLQDSWDGRLAPVVFIKGIKEVGFLTRISVRGVRADFISTATRPFAIIFFILGMAYRPLLVSNLTFTERLPGAFNIIFSECVNYLCLCLCLCLCLRPKKLSAPENRYQRHAK